MAIERIWLIGMPGSGKTTTASLLASNLGWVSVDTDEIIEKAHDNDTIAHIIKQHDLDYFRSYERDTVSILSEATRTVISTGGGAVLAPENRLLMEMQGSITIFLNIPLKQLEERLLKTLLHERPLLASQKPLLNILEDIWTERKAYYQSADIEIPIQELESPHDIVNKILQQLTNIPLA